MRVALKIAYDGTRFHGYARQPNVRTVEGEILHSLRRAKLLDDPRAARFEGASRTDRGVSALGNVIAFDSRLGPKAAGAFNAEAEDVVAWAGAVVLAIGAVVTAVILRSRSRRQPRPPMGPSKDP